MPADKLIFQDMFVFVENVPVEVGWLDWICLMTTRPSGHFSRPTQVNVSQSCFHSLNNYSSLIILCTSGG